MGSDDEIAVELEDEYEVGDADAESPAAEGANSVASAPETIGVQPEPRPRIGSLPTALRAAVLLAAFAVLTVVAWPTAGRREAVPPPTPTRSDDAAAMVFLGGTGVSAGNDHATLSLQLTNNAPEPVTLVGAELRDALGMRLGSDTIWPAQNLAAHSTTTVSVTMPYACGVQWLPVLPITIRYTVSTSQASEDHHDYASELADPLWDTFTSGRTTQCAQAYPDAGATVSGNGIFATAIDTTQPIGAPSDPQGFDMTFLFKAAGSATWSVQQLVPHEPGVTVTASGLPASVRPGQTTRVTTHWHIDDCANPPSGAQGSGDLRFAARMAGGGPAKGTGDARAQPFMELPPGLETEMVRVACGS